LLNQPFATLYDMLRFQNSEQLQQLALDQTPIYKSAMLGAAHPLSEQFQVSADATIVNLSQPIMPLGLDPSLGSLPAGNEYYFSSQLVGSNLFKQGDMYTGALRYSRLLTTDMYVLDLNTRYPMTNEWHISPRLRLGYSLGRGMDHKEFTALPSVLVDYYWNKGLSFEAEVGAQWTNTAQSGIKSNDTELLATIGLRYDFYPDVNARPAEVRAKCATPAAAALCRYGTQPDGGTCASPPPGCR
jgi:hypothetical protein